MALIQQFSRETLGHPLVRAVCYALCSQTKAKANVKVGDMVVRGPDWRWGDQDGGDGHKGRVLKILEGSEQGWINVRWDDGDRVNNYRYGAQGCYDVLVVTTPEVTIFPRCPLNPPT